MLKLRVFLRGMILTCALWTKSRTKKTDTPFSQINQNTVHLAKTEKLGKTALQFELFSLFLKLKEGRFDPKL